MRKHYRIARALCAASIAGFVLLATPAYSETHEWLAYVQRVSGGASQCPDGGSPWIREGNGKFVMLSKDKKFEIWSIARNPDGSAKGESYSNLTKAKLQVVIPPGTGPRTFEYVNVAYGCTFRVTAGK